MRQYLEAEIRHLLERLRGQDSVLELGCGYGRVTRRGGLLLFSTYADAFWPHRLAWFEAQSEAGLLRPLDREACRDGVIACTDGFRSGRFTIPEWRSLCARLDMEPRFQVVDESSLFCETHRQGITG